MAVVDATPDSVLGDFLSALSRWLEAPPDAILAAWRAHDPLKGERVRWSDGEGIADGIADFGEIPWPPPEYLVPVGCGNKQRVSLAQKLGAALYDGT